MLCKKQYRIVTLALTYRDENRTVASRWLPALMGSSEACGRLTRLATKLHSNKRTSSCLYMLFLERK